MRRLMGAALALLMLLAGAAAALADDLTPEQRMLMQLFGLGPITADMFAPGFLAQASLQQILAIFDKERGLVGPPLSVERRDDGYIVHTAKFAVPVQIGLDSAGRVASIVLRQASPNFENIDDVLAAIGKLNGDVSYLITRNGSVLYAQRQTKPLAVFSGFKLAVLAALADEIKAGRLAWDQVVRLDPAEISMTPGVLQDFPAGAPLTVHTLAALMTAQSDNTATDTLIDLVGRDRVAARLGADFALKTTEFYKLKADPAARLRFAAADAAGKRQAALDLDKMPLPEPADVVAPLDDGVEWYLSSTQLCRLMGDVAGLDVFNINPGVAHRADWSRIAFKGGSETGVISLTTQVSDKAGDTYCITLTVNAHQPIDEATVTADYEAMVGEMAPR